MGGANPVLDGRRTHRRESFEGRGAKREETRLRGEREGSSSRVEPEGERTRARVDPGTVCTGLVRLRARRVDTELSGETRDRRRRKRAQTETAVVVR